jgi:hypothetical protein
MRISTNANLPMSPRGTPATKAQNLPPSTPRLRAEERQYTLTSSMRVLHSNTPPAAAFIQKPVVAVFENPSASGSQVGDLVALEAEAALISAVDTRYQHKSDIDPQSGRYYADCSGFVAFLLKQIDPTLLDAIPTTHARPLAEDYYNAFAMAPTVGKGGPNAIWERVPKASQIRPGDVIALDHPNWQPGQNTGHVMVVLGLPEPVYRHGKLVAYNIRVADSTTQPHSDDTRPAGTDGIGSGVIAVVVDRQNRPIGIQNGQYSHHAKTKSPVAVGRINSSSVLFPFFAEKCRVMQ